MNTLTVIAVSLAIITPVVADAAPKKKGALDDTTDLFAMVTPDRRLGDLTRRKWLTLWPVDGREYWAAWDCKGKRCDTPKRAHIRATAKLIPRTDADPKPLPPDTSAPKNR
ncbi:hypothetical protein [Asticcacaulis sp.]|uniref:hypothetical protein n=1 Tax=Asticcacaulis sp. TaxID=1872648 RepID=UPI003F7BBD54